MIETISQVSIQPEIILFTAICVGLVISLATLCAALGAMREGRRASKTLEERLARVEHDLLRAHWSEMDAQKEVQKLTERLEEQRPERLFGQLEHATQELEQLHLRLSESERLVGQQKQELSQQSEQQERERQHLEQKEQQLMEEVKACDQLNRSFREDTFSACR